MTYKMNMQANEFLNVNDGVRLREFTARDIDRDETKPKDDGKKKRKKSKKKKAEEGA